MTDGKGATQPKTAPNHHNTNTDKDAGKRHFTSGDGAGEDIQHRQAGSGDDRIDAVELTRRLGFTAGEYISLSWKRPGDAPWRYRVVGYEPHRLANYIAMAGAGVNHYFLINPVRSDTAKRGRADEITRLADLPVEIDGYKNGHATVETVCGFAIELSQKIGEAPVGIVESGGGWHIHWAVAGGEIGGDFPVAAAKELLLCWRALAGLVAGNHGITLDPIFDLARVLRLPGTVNAKYRPARPVVAHDLPGGPIALPELRRTLHEHVPPPPPPRPPRPRRVVTAVTGYAGVPGDRGHPYYRRAEAGLLAEFGNTEPGARNAALNATTYKLARIALARGRGRRHRRHGVFGAARGGARRGLADRPREKDQDMTAGFGQKTDESKASIDGQAGGGNTLSWQRIDLGGVIAGECQPVVPTLLERTDGQHLLYPGLTHSLHGEPESAKSLLMQAEAAVRINRGEAVLYLDFESDKESVVARLLELGAHRQAILDHFHYVRPEVAPHSSPPEQAAWEAVLSVRYTLAVIDSVTEALAVLALSSTNNDDLAVWSQMVPRRIADATGAAVVLIDHVVKDIRARNRWAIGGQTKMARLTGASYSLEVHQALGRGMRGELRLRVGKDRPGSVRPHCGPYRKDDRTQEAARIVIDSTDGPTVITVWPPGNDGDAGQDDNFRPTTLMERVSRHVEAHPGECTKDGLTKEVTGKKTYLRLAVDILTDEGFLTVGPGKRSGSRVYTSVRPYCEADDPLSDSYSDLADRPPRNMTSGPAGGGVG